MEQIILSPWQAEVASDLHRFRVVNCGRRAGKTTLVIDQMKACAAYRESRIAYLAPTFTQARDIAWESLKKDCAQAAKSVNESRLEIRLANVKGTESLIMLRGWESVESLRGQSFDLIVLDEVAMMRNFWRAWEEVVRPTLTDRRGEAIFTSTPKGFNHFYDLYNLQESDLDFKSFHFTTYDNPNIPPDEIDKAKEQLTEDRFSQEYLADFRKMEGLVYKEFDREKHVVSPEDIKNNVYVEKILGIDFGFTNPAAVLTICRDSTDAYFITDEFYERGKTDPQVVEYASKLGANRVYADPEAASAVALLRRAGCNVRDVVKGKGSVKHGIDLVRELLKANKLKISSNCTNLILELETYSYPDRKPGHNEQEDPIKENDHACDALRYVIMMINKGSNGVAQTYRPSYVVKPSLPSMAQGSPQSSAPRVIPTSAHQYRPSYK